MQSNKDNIVPRYPTARKCFQKLHTRQSEIIITFSRNNSFNYFYGSRSLSEMSGDFKCYSKRPSVSELAAIGIASLGKQKMLFLFKKTEILKINP